MELYFAYSHKNEKEGVYIQKMLTPIVDRFHCSLWSMSAIIPGHNWQMDIDEHLKNAFLFVPLVSAEFLASEVCMMETNQAMNRSTPIAPILLDFCLVEYSVFAKFDFLPKGGVPVKAWKRRSEAWANVQRELIKIIQEKING